MKSKYRKDHGASLTEYAVMIALVSVIAVAGIAGTGRNAAEQMCKGVGGFKGVAGGDVTWTGKDCKSGTCIPGFTC